MAAYDLTTKVSEHLDRHLIFALLEFLSSKDIYDSKELLRARFELLSQTNMVDFWNTMYQELHQTTENVPGFKTRSYAWLVRGLDLLVLGFEQKRDAVVKRLDELQSETSELFRIIQDPEVLHQLKPDKMSNVLFLQEHYGFRPEMLGSLFQFAMHQFQSGNYAGCAEMLYHFRILSTNESQNLSALWGKLACEILIQNWETALDNLTKLREEIDTCTFQSHLEQLQQRTFFIHWSLFVFFNHPKGRDGIIDVLFQPQYLSTIQISCPWILRYLATAVLTSKKRRNVMKELIRVIQQESHTYRDPITEFVECLYVHFDFDGAQATLKACESVLANDYFVVATRHEFMDHARLLMFETYCRMHQCIDIQGLSQRLNLDKSEGEKWIVNLIRNARLDAKIDAETNTVIMGTLHQSIYQQVIEKTKSLSFRTTLLAANIEKREIELAKQRAKA